MGLLTAITMAGVGASIAGAAGVGKPGLPSAPNPTQAALTTAQAQADAALLQRAIAQREALGEGPPAGSTSRQMNRQQLEALSRQLRASKDPAQREQGLILEPLATAARNTGKPQTVWQDASGNYISGSNFSGQSTANIQGGLAGQQADQSIALGQKYGVPYAQQAAAEVAQADPQGTAARNAQYQLLENQINNPLPINPLSGQLDTSIDAQVKAGAGLDPASQQLLESAVQRANADRGGNLAAGNVAQSMSTGASGQARLQAAEDKAGQWLASGQTPAEIQRAREQMNLSGLSQFIGGNTPESEYRNLSGMEYGATPYYPGAPAPTMPTNAGTIGPNAAATAYGNQVQSNLGQTSWLSALGGLFTKGAGMIGG